MNAVEAAADVIKWRDDVKTALINFERTRTDRAVAGNAIKSRDDATFILNAAKALRLCTGQLVEACEKWIDAQEPPIRAPITPPFEE